MVLGKGVSSDLHHDVYYSVFIKAFLIKTSLIDEKLNTSIFLKMGIQSYGQYGFE